MASTSGIEIVLNGERHSVPEGSTLATLVRSLALDPARVAVELERHIVRRPEWESTPLSAGAKVEIVHFVGGG